MENPIRESDVGWRILASHHARDAVVLREAQKRKGIHITDGPYFLLALALENMLKARIHAQTGQPNRKDHDVIKLANEARITVEPDDESWLRKVTDLIVWQGRYPTNRRGSSGEPLYHDKVLWAVMCKYYELADDSVQEAKVIFEKEVGVVEQSLRQNHYKLGWRLGRN